MSEPERQPIQAPESYIPPDIPKIMRLAEQAQRETAYPGEFILPDRSTPPPPEAEYKNCPSYVSFANEFAYFMDYSGRGYGFIERNKGWRCDINYTLADVITGYAARPCCLAVTPEGLDRLYRAAGFPARRTYCADPARAGHMDEAEMKEAIKYTLCTLGQPVIMSFVGKCFGVIVIGYKEHGDVLVTFSYPPYFLAPDNIQPQIEETRDWYQEKTTLTIVGARQSPLPVKELYRLGLRQIRAYLRAGIHGEDRHYYDEWGRFLRLNSLEQMLAEAERLGTMPGAQIFYEESTEKSIDVLADPTFCELAERRYYIMHFFYQAAEHFPEEKAALNALGDQFWFTSEIMGNQKKGYVSKVGHDPVNMELFAKKSVRAHMARCVRKFRRADAKGLAMTEKLLSRLGL